MQDLRRADKSGQPHGNVRITGQGARRSRRRRQLEGAGSLLHAELQVLAEARPGRGLRGHVLSLHVHRLLEIPGHHLRSTRKLGYTEARHSEQDDRGQQS